MIIGIPAITFAIGIVTDHYYKQNSNKREKARDIVNNVLLPIKNSTAEPKQQLKTGKYITFPSAGKTVFSLDKNHFRQRLLKSNIFREKDGQIVLSYKKDRIWRKHSDSILDLINRYHNDVELLQQYVSDLTVSDIPDYFEPELRRLIETTFGKDDLERDERREELLFIVFVSALTDAASSYTSGRTCVVDIIREQLGPLKTC
jgi:hypothetical protein